MTEPAASPASVLGVPDLLFMVDRTGRILDCKTSPQRVMRIPPEQMVGHRAEDFLPASAAQALQAGLARTLAEGPQPGISFSVAFPDGERNYESFIVPPFGPLAADERLAVIVSDVTARARTEEALRESEARARAVNDNLPGGFVYQVDTGADGRQRQVTFVSKGVERLHGITPEEMMRDDAAVFYRQVLEEDRPRLADLEARAVATMTPFRAEVRFRLPSGEIRWGLVTSAPRRMPNGHLLWDGIEMDITERKQAETAQRASEAKYRLLFESIRDAFVSVDMAGHVLEHNQAYEELTGYSAEELRHLTYVDLTPEKWRAFEAQLIAEQVLPRGFSEVYEKEYRRKDGTLVPIELRTILIRDAAGQPAGMWATIRDVAARQRAEQALSRSRDLLDVTQRLVHVGGWEWDVERQAMDWTDETYRIHGMPVGEIAAGSPEHVARSLACYDPADRPIIAAAFRRCAAEGCPYDLEFPLNRVDGQRIWIRTVANAVKEGGRIVKVVGTIMDVTERKRADRFLRLVLDLIPGGVFWKDRNSVFLGCNQTIAQGAGLESPAQIVGKTDYDLGWKKEESDFYVAVDRRVMENDQAEYHIVEPQRQAGGQEIWLDTCKIPLHDEAGRVVGILGTFTDITERLRLERELKVHAAELERRVQARTAELEASRAALEKNEALFRQMAEGIQEVFWLFEVQTHKALFISPSFERVWGRSRADVSRDMAAWLACIQPEDQARVRRRFEQVMVSGEFEPIQYRIVHPDGTVRWLEDRAWAIRDGQGSVYRVAGVSRDITEHRRLESEVLKAGEAERQRIGRDLHDGLSQALTAIGYWAEAVRNSLAKASRPEAADVQKLVGWIAKTGQQARAMAQGLLLTDLKRGGLLPALQELALTTQEFFGVACRYRGPQAVALSSVEVAQQLYRIAQEAATNAAKHSKGKTIDIRLAKTRAGLRLTIRDDGQGLPPLEGARAGLGLEIMRYRAGLIGATLSLASAPGRGTRVTCLIPQAAAPPRKKTS